MTDLPDLIELTPNGLHQPFLEKAVEGDEGYPEGMLAAFLTLRVVDQFAAAHWQSESTHYQIRATREYLERLDRGCPEVRYLLDIIEAASKAISSCDPPLILQSLTSFSDWLERDLQLAQALDVLNTAARVFQGDDEPSSLQLHLRRARVLRRMGLFAEASEAYSIAEHLAKSVDDHHHQLLAQIGQGIVLQHRGNLPAARAVLEKVRDRAMEANDTDAESRARHDLAVNCLLRERYEDAAIEAFRAFQLYESIESRGAALSDLAVALRMLGHDEAARDAFEVALAANPSQAQRTNVTLGLMSIATRLGDRIAFERHRRWLEEIQETLPAGPRADFEIKVGEGLARFGLLRKARIHLQRAIEYAEKMNLNRYLFEAEDALSGVDAQIAALDEQLTRSTAEFIDERAPDADTPGDASWPDEITELSRSLRRLRQHAEVSAGV